jgi:hypothetical protein
MVASFLLNLAFLNSLLLVNSNKTFLLISLLYLIILIRKTQNYRLSLLLLFINLLPLTIGRNLLDVTLIAQKEIFSFAIYDVKYFLPIYLSDLFLLLIYQNYFSKKFFSSVLNKTIGSPLSHKNRITYSILLCFFLLILLRSVSHEFAPLLLAGSLIILKYILIFGLPFLIQLNKLRNYKELLAAITAMTVFHSVTVIYEQIKGGNLGLFIENRLPGLELGTRAAEAGDMLRADGIFNEPNITATFLLMNLTLMLDLGLKNLTKKITANRLYFGISGLAILAITFTGSRSLYFLTSIVLIYYLALYRQTLWPQLRQLLRKKLMLLITTTVVLLTSPYLLSRMQSLSNVFSRDGSLSYRSELNSHVLSMSFSNYLGIGLDLTPYYLAKNFKTVDSPLVIFDQAPAHNIIVQLLAETGIIATVIFISFVYITIKHGYQGKHRTFALAAIVYFLAAQFHPVFTNHYQLTGFFFLYLGVANFYDQK